MSDPTPSHRIVPARTVLYAALQVVVLSVLGILCCLLPSSTPVRAQATGETVGVYYVGPEDAIASSIDRAAPYVVRVDQPDLAQVIVINNAPLRETLETFGTEIQDERLGLVLFCGSFFPQTVDDLRLLLGFSTFGLDQTGTPTQVFPAGNDDPLARAITWRSAPELQARTLITNPNLLQPIVTTPGRQGIIQRVRGRGESQALIVGSWLSHPSNALWQDWGYYDYLVYRLVVDAADVSRPLTYADYPRSPTPHRPLRWAIAGAGIGLILAAGAVTYLARRRLYLLPETTDAAATFGAISRPNLPSGEDTDRAKRTMVSQERVAAAPTQSGWDHAGFHRPLAGFLTVLPAGLLLAAPLLIYERIFLPDMLMSDALGYNTWIMVSQWTLAFWALLDAGMGVAAVRYFATSRRHWPNQASKYLQFYVWWQFLSGALQVGLVAILTAVALPVFGLAHLSYYLLARTMLQFPGFFQVFAVAFRARERFDYEQLLLLFSQVITPVLQVAFALILQPVGEASAEFTAGIAGAFGLAAGIWGGQFLTFVLGARLFRRERLPLSSLFLPTYDARVTGEMLRFGLPWAIGAAMPGIGILLQSILLERFLLPFGLSTTSWLTLIRFTAVFEILLISLYRSLMPGLTEAATFDYKTLLRYYVSQGIRYGAWFSFFLFSIVGAFGPPALSMAPTPWAQSDLRLWLVPLAAWGALRWAVWLPDRMLEAAGHPGWVSALTIIEQVIRIGGGYVLLQLWGPASLPAAYAVALLVRAILAKWVAGRFLVRARIYIWQTLFVPAVCGLIVYELLQVLSLTLLPTTWQGVSITTIALVLPALLLYAFLTAVLGGWDDGSLRELRTATRISGLGRPFAWLLLQVVAFGAGHSPLHNRFPIHLYELAQDEAQAMSYAQRPPP